MPLTNDKLHLKPLTHTAIEILVLQVFDLSNWIRSVIAMCNDVYYVHVYLFISTNTCVIQLLLYNSTNSYCLLNSKIKSNYTP